MGAVCAEAVVHLYPADTARKVVLSSRTFLDDETLQLMHDRGIFSISTSRELRLRARTAILRRLRGRILT